ncbi:MAG: hypothetical protein DRJ40_08560 [Thermoprotei archaeon]|nr:MAG: hypothetical protein DRJ40_08560 [Thermoprotei archaeon]
MPILRKTKLLLLDEHASQSAPKIAKEVLSSIRKLRDLLRIVWSLRTECEVTLELANNLRTSQ